MSYNGEIYEITINKQNVQYNSQYTIICPDTIEGVNVIENPDDSVCTCRILIMTKTLLNILF